MDTPPPAAPAAILDCADALRAALQALGAAAPVGPPIDEAERAALSALLFRGAPRLVRAVGQALQGAPALFPGEDGAALCARQAEAAAWLDLCVTLEALLSQARTQHLMAQGGAAREALQVLARVRHAAAAPVSGTRRAGSAPMRQAAALAGPLALLALRQKKKRAAALRRRRAEAPAADLRPAPRAEARAEARIGSRAEARIGSRADLRAGPRLARSSGAASAALSAALLRLQARRRATPRPSLANAAAPGDRRADPQPPPLRADSQPPPLRADSQPPPHRRADPPPPPLLRADPQPPRLPDAPGAGAAQRLQRDPRCLAPEVRAQHASQGVIREPQSDPPELPAAERRRGPAAPAHPRRRRGPGLRRPP